MNKKPYSLAHFLKQVAVVGCLLFFVACASGPKLYPNEKYERVGKEQAQADIKFCEARAEKFLESPRGKKMLAGAGKGAAMGGVVGAVAGIFTGNVARGLAQGAAIGAAGGAAAGAMSPDELKQKFVTRCLQKKGYEVLGYE